MDWTFVTGVDWNYWIEEALRTWYLSGGAVGGLALAAAVAVLVIGLSGWRLSGLLLKVVALAALAATAPLGADRLGFDIPAWNRDALGYLSMGGTLVSLKIVVVCLALSALGRLFPRSRVIQRATTIFTRPVERRAAMVFSTMTRGKMRAAAADLDVAAPRAPVAGPATARQGAQAPPRPAETRVAPRPGASGAWLLVHGAPDGGMHQLHGGDNSIGRDADNDVSIQDSYLSRRHAMIRFQAGRAVLYDLGSAAGTAVNGEAIEGCALVDGETVRLGDSTLTVVTHDRGDAAPGVGGDATMVASRPGAGGATLVASTGPDAGRGFALSEGDNLVGRDPECQVCLNDPSVSRRHALVRLERGALTVFNIGGRSPVEVGGRSLSGRVLAHDDTISVGHTTMTFVRPTGR